MASIPVDPDRNLAPAVPVPAPAPVRQLNPATLRNLGARYKALFDRYSSERQPAEQKWLRNLRQYKGIYDPDIERQLAPNRSKAYPRITRMKCVSMLSRLMNLMFPGNEDNWELQASPSPSMSPQAVAQAVNELMAEYQAQGEPPALTQELINEAVKRLADKQAAKLSALIKDQLMELGGDQSKDWIGLNRQVTDSAVKYGLGVLEGPYIRKVEESGWMLAVEGGPAQFRPVNRTLYKPQYNFLRCWDFYPDMSANDLPGEGYFVRKVLGRSKLRKLADRADFFGAQVKQCLLNIPGGNYQAKSWELELKGMGVSIHTQVNSYMHSGREKYEVIIWKGPVSAATLREAGAEVPEQFMADDVEAELWMVDNWIIKAAINPWRKLGVDMKCVHTFSFDEDDTSPISEGLPNVVRDSQMSICAATRMTLDNASVVCGPIFEINTASLDPTQDVTSIAAYKHFYRDDDTPNAQFPAVRQISVDGHLGDLQNLIKMFMEFAEVETFIGPLTGGDKGKVPSEPMRTIGGASMLFGDAALPFKDIVRNYDSFTQSTILSLVHFNKVYNPTEAPEGDYDVIARGATSLIAKEVRGIQIDTLSQTMTPEERDHVDERKFIEAKFASRDMQGMLVSEGVAKQRKEARAQVQAEQKAMADEMMRAQIRETLAGAVKDLAQAKKNEATADAAGASLAMDILEMAQDDDEPKEKSGGAG